MRQRAVVVGLAINARLLAILASRADRRSAAER
jgi:hypothetical protein